MDIAKMIRLTLKAKKLTEKGINMVSKLPMEKIIVGTVVTVVPGAMVATGAYMAGNKLLKKYREYKASEEVPKGFVSWAKDETSGGIANQAGNAKDFTVKAAVVTGKTLTNHTKNAKRYAVNKAASFLTKK